MRSKAFFLNGGAGRIICSIPALEKYAETHDDFVIVCEGGTDFLKGHPKLYEKAYDNWHKGLFQEKLINMDLVTPEPYREWHYFNQKASLAQAFDIIINELDEPRELPIPEIVLSKNEICAGYTAVEEVKAGTGKDKLLVVQPFGRSVETIGQDFIVDSTSRSFGLNNVVEIINKLKKDYAIIIMSEIHFPLEKDEGKSAATMVARPEISDMRLWAGIIHAADHFLGCDSMGQHIAMALDTTTTMVCGSTFPENISYPGNKNMDIIDVGKDRNRKYSPIRVTIDEVVDRGNDECMEMGEDHKKAVIDSVKKRMGKPAAYTGNFQVQSQDYANACCDKPQQPKMLPQNNKPKVKFDATKTKGFGQIETSNPDVKNILQKLK